MKRKETLPAAAPQARNLPAVQGAQALMLSDIGQGRTGFESMGADDFAIPFISILQAMSPQVHGASKIKGAEEGDFFNTVSNEVLKDQIRIIPCAYQKAWVEWVDREAGGGFVRQHLTMDILDKTERNSRGQDVLKGVTPQHNIVATAYHYCLLVRDNGSTERVVLAFTSTQLKKSRKWNTQMMKQEIEVAEGKRLPAPMFSHMYTMRTVEESKDAYSWAGWEISEPTVLQSADLYLTAKKFHDDVTHGMVKTAQLPEAEQQRPQGPATTVGGDEAF